MRHTDLCDRHYWGRHHSTGKRWHEIVTWHTINRKRIFDKTSTRHLLTYCKIATLQIGWHGSQFYLNNCRLLIRKLNIDKTTQIVVQESLRSRILYLGHHPPFSRHPGQRKTYDTLRKFLYCSCTAKEIFATVAQCASGVRNGSKYKQNRCLQLFFAKESLELDVKDVPGSLPKIL